MKYLDYQGLEYLIAELKLRFVQTQEGKGLSANDFTNILKTKLDGIATGAQVNTVDSVNGKEGKVVLTSDDIEFISSVSGSTATTVRAIIDSIIAKEKEQDNLIKTKADKSSVYTKTEVDGQISANSDALALKADKVDTYTKIETDAEVTAAVKNKTDKTYVDGELDKKANQSTTYTKIQVDDSLDTKADKIDVYTKTQTDAELKKKANQATTYTKEEVDGKIAGIDSGVISVNAKTGVVVLDADDISDEETSNKFTTTLEKSAWTNKAEVSYVDAAANKKVDKVTGKSLSTNDFTNTLKNKLDGMEVGAKDNTIELITRNGSNLPIAGKTVDIEVPTALSELRNDTTFQTKVEIQTLIADQGKLKKKIVTALPPVGSTDDNTMYLIKNIGKEGYQEYMLIEGVFEILGDTAAVDFTGYVHEDDIKSIQNAEIDILLNV